MAYQVLARKWRPQNFKDMVGQDHISSTLCNAIKNQRIGHAYLFVGTRGTGKTTTARIFAKAINCENPLPDANPCGVCTNCLEITAGSCMDVLEIDGASNNGVDDIRRLRDNVQYTPARCNYKVYIIDEVHMLSTAAWNALLKTLEEPPEHVKFLFATTEAHKVLPTILSRCQRFDLKRISQGTISRRLQEIAELEKASFDQSALNAIARAANGGMRDALSIMDQMIAFCNNQQIITEHDVSEVFGLTSNNDLAKITVAMLNDQPTKLILELNHLADVGRNLEQLYSDLLHFSRNLMICAISGDQAKNILDLDQHEIIVARDIVAQTNTDILQRLVDGYLAHDGQLRHTLNKRVFLEMTLVRIMKDVHAASLTDILKRLNSLRKSGSFDALEIETPTKEIKISIPDSPEKKNLIDQEVQTELPTDSSTQTPPFKIDNSETIKDNLNTSEEASKVESAIQPTKQASELVDDKPDYLKIVPEKLISDQIEETKAEQFFPHPVTHEQKITNEEAHIAAEQKVKAEITVAEEALTPHLNNNTIEKITVDDTIDLPYSTLIDVEYISDARLMDPCNFGLQRYQADFDENEETPGSALGVFYYKESDCKKEQLQKPAEASATSELIKDEELKADEAKKEIQPKNNIQSGYTPEQYIDSSASLEANIKVTQPERSKPSESKEITNESPKDAADRIWNSFLAIIHENKTLNTDCFSSLVPASFSANTFIFTSEASIDISDEILQSLKNTIQQIEAISEVDIKVVAASTQKESSTKQLSSNEEVWGRVRSNALFMKLCQEFNGTIIDVRG